MTLLRISTLLVLAGGSLYAAPVITSYTGSAPTAGGVFITVNGSGLGTGSDDPSKVKLESNIIPAASQSGTSLTFILPPGQGTDIPLSVIDGSSNVSNVILFAYDPPAIAFIDLAPPGGWVTACGQPLTISGTNFGTNGVVRIGGIVAPQSAYSHSSISVTTPPGAGLNVPLVVAVGGQLSSPQPFSYNAPAITSATPPAGIPAAGAEIILDGTDFGPDEPTVLFGAEAATVIAYTDTSITVTKPVTFPGDSGIVVTQNGGQASEAIPFPTLTSLPGYYVDVDNAQVLPAPAGKFTDTPDALQPQPASLGFYTPISGMRSQIAASPGYYVDSTSSSIQVPAPIGRYVATPASTSASDAGGGSYVPVEGMRAAIPASPGYFVQTTGATTQTPVPAGRFTNTPGSTTGTSAPPGRYAPIPGMQDAIDASPGYYVDSEGMMNQTPADFGTFVAGTGLTSATQAPAGKYAPLKSMRGAIPAPEGTYSPSAGASNVLTIPAGFTTDAGGTTLVPLPQTQIVAYTLESNGDNSISFDSVDGQNYALFYTENLVDFTMLTTLAGTGGVVANTFTPPVSSTGRRFYIVGPIDLPGGS